MSEITFGSDGHIAGLSRRALEADFRWVDARRHEMEDECERLRSENARLTALCGMLCGRLRTADRITGMGWMDERLAGMMRELGVEAD